MLGPIKHLLARKRVVLASGSPRRQELVQLIGLKAELCPSKFEENLNPADFDKFSDFLESTALGKAEEVYHRLSKDSDPANLIIISADTMVTLGKEIFGKPNSAEHAVQILSRLAGNCNTAHTGVVIKHSGGIIKFTESAKVYFGKFTKDEIQAYVDSGEPLDKAGAYGITGLGGTLIEKIEGDYYAVVGLPIHRLCVELRNLLSNEL